MKSGLLPGFFSTALVDSMTARMTMQISLIFEFCCVYDLSFEHIDLAEIRKLTANVEAVLLGVIIPLCQRNSGRLEEADREVQSSSLILIGHSRKFYVS